MYRTDGLPHKFRTDINSTCVRHFVFARFIRVYLYLLQTIHEFKAIMNGYIMRNSSKGGDTFMAPSNMGPLADSVDWRDKGYVTAVKNQVQYDITSWHQATWDHSPTVWTGGTKATLPPSKTRYSMILHHGTKQHGTPRRQRRLEGQRLRHGRQKPGTV